MNISGQHTVGASRQQVWDALQDPAVLARTLPGCAALEVVGEDTYRATVTAGVASVKGTYDGEVALTDKQAPSSYRLTAQGAGAPGTIRADAQVRLEERDGATVVHYDADAVVGGMIGGVGQRMLAGVARRTAGEFFAAIERDLLEGPIDAAPAAPSAAPGAEPAASAAGTAPAAGEPQVGQVFRRPEAPAADRRALELLGAVALGAAIALVGVAVGRRTARRRV